MKLRPIKTEQEYDEMMVWIDEQFDRKVDPDSPEGEIVQVALLLVKAYEDEHYAYPPQIQLTQSGLKCRRMVFGTKILLASWVAKAMFQPC